MLPTRLFAWSALIPTVLVLLFARCWSFGQPVKLPPLAEIKAAAEKGDPVAQDQLGEAYRGRFDFSKAELWYRKAAEAGVANSQWQLGMLYLNGAPKMSGEKPVSKKEREAIKWLSKAANQDNVRAQIELGHCYANGRAVQKDNVEGYKWYALAANHNEILGQVHRDRLILKMTSDQIAEGQRRAASFRVSRESSTRPPQITLQGIAGFKDHRQAIINGRTFGVGDENEIEVNGKPVKVRCIEIRDDSVLLQIDQEPQPREFTLTQK
jgi:TPR repeat protein